MYQSRILHGLILSCALVGIIRIAEWCNSLPSYNAGDHAGFEELFHMTLNDYNQAGFKQFLYGFNTLTKCPDLNETIIIKNLKLHVVGSRQYFRWPKAAEHGSTIIGYATRNNEIYVMGGYQGNKIVINQAVLGHEFAHIVNFNNPQFINPDKIK